MSSWQVFGLAGCLLARLPSLVPKPVPIGRSFLLTAAGQFRILTGFPSSLRDEAQSTTSEDYCILCKEEIQAQYIGIYVKISGPPRSRGRLFGK
jgi:hypothetical protein